MIAGLTKELAETFEAKDPIMDQEEVDEDAVVV